jgi:hypothetical protein
VRPIDAAAWIVSLPILAFLSVAVTVVAANPFFFAAHGITPIIFAIVAVLAIALVTTVVWLVLLALKRFGSPTVFDVTATTVTAASAVISLAAIAVRILSTRMDLRAAWVVGVGLALVGAALVTLLSRRAGAGRVLLVISSSVTIFPLIAISETGSDDEVTIAFDDSTARPPILLFVADELSYTAVSDESGSVRPAFENIAKFQTSATTYTNAYSTANATHLAIPTLLAGVPDATTLGEYPASIRSSGGPLSWLQSRYRVATDSIYFKESGEGVPFVDLEAGPMVSEQSESGVRDAAILLADTFAVVLQTAVPAPLTDLAPSLDDRWYDFWNIIPEAPVVGVGGEFIDVLVNDQEPGFAFVHSMVSHTPYVRDYAGQFWSPNSLGLNTDGLGTASVAELQRQVYVASALDLDRQFGFYVNELQQAGMFDEALIIFTADHGRTFPLENTWRVGDDRNQRWQDVAHVPLMVKLPGQTMPEVVNGVRSTAQISGTIMDAAGASVSIRDQLAPPLSEDPAQAPVFWFDKRTGEAGVESYEPFVASNDWRPEHFLPRHPSSPFAIGMDVGLIGEPVPEGLSLVASQPAEVDEGSSPLRVIEVSRGQDMCATDAGFGLVSHDGTVVGSIAWGSPASGSVTGWSIVPEFDSGTMDVWC